MRTMEAMFGRTPRPDTLGYQAALEVGLAISDAGASVLALSYFDRAATLRPTPVALTKKGRCLRDLGRLEEAEDAYRHALEAGGTTGHALVGLIAVLCDLRCYEDALPLARQAAADHPDNPAALTVAARCLDEFADVLSRSDQTNGEQLALAKVQARDLRDRARELDPSDESDRLHRQRERAFPVHSIAPIAVESPEALSAGRGEGDQGSAAVTASKPGGLRLRIGLLRRLRVLFGRR